MPAAQAQTIARAYRTREKHEEKCVSGNSHTIEDRSLEETNELEEEILLFSRQLVPSRLSPASLNISRAQTELHIGSEPVVGSLESLTLAPGLGLAREETLLLGLHTFVGARSSRTPTAITVGGDVSDEISILAHVGVVFGHGIATGILLAVVATVLNVVVSRHCIESKRAKRVQTMKRGFRVVGGIKVRTIDSIERD